MNKKLICFDLDGTLLNDRKLIPSNNIKALNMLRDMGHIISIATGRMYKSAKKVKSMIPGEVEIICSNGAVIENADRIIRLERIPLEHHEIIYDITKKYPLPLTFDSLNRAYHTKIAATLRHHHFMNVVNKGDLNIHNVHIKNKDQYMKFARYFVNGIVITRTRKDLLKKLRKELENTGLFNIESSSPDNLEIIPKNSDKGVGSSYLAHYHGISQKDIIAFGDAENDLKMLQMAGISVAMGNGSDLIKHEADIITDTNLNDGIPKALENLFNIRILK